MPKHTLRSKYDLVQHRVGLARPSMIMCELLLIYTAIAMTDPVALIATSSHPRFMPFAEHDWLWQTIGFTGIGIFGTRFVVQWIYSEKHKESRIPVIFWWQSLAGTILCLAYFVWKPDWVGISGYLFNIIPYTRNLVLVYRKKRQEAAGEPEVLNSRGRNNH